MKTTFGVLAVVLLFLSIGLLVWGAVDKSKDVGVIATGIVMAGFLAFFCYLRVGKPLKESLKFLLVYVLTLVGIYLINLLPDPWSGRVLLFAIVASAIWAAMDVWLKKRKRERPELPAKPPEAG